MNDRVHNNEGQKCFFFGYIGPQPQVQKNFQMREEAFTFSISTWLIALIMTVPFLAISTTTEGSFGYGPASEIKRLIELSDENRDRGDYSTSRNYLNQAYQQARSSEDTELIARVKNQIGVLFIYETRYSLALSNLQEALTLYREISHQEGIAECLNNMASIHIYLNNLLQAKENYKKSLEIRQRGGDLRKLGISYNNLGIVHSRMNELDSALIYHHQSLNIWEQLDDLSGIGLTLSHIGSIIKKQGDLEGALVVMEESYEKLERGERSYLQTQKFVEAEIGLLLTMLDRHEESIQWCEGICKSAENTVFKRASKNCCKALYFAYLGLKDHEKALEAYTLFIDLRDTLLGTEMVQEVTRMELNYAFQQIHRADSLRFESERNFHHQRLYNQRLGLAATVAILFVVSILGFVIYKGKRRTEDLLLNILPAPVAKELKKTGTASPRKYDSVSVLFADIKGFTEISANLSPEELVSEINQYFTAFDEIMEKFGIEKIKTIGDCYMAASGLPIETEDHREKMVTAALEMQKVIAEINSQKTDPDQTRFKLRIGIHSGPVVAGIVGTKKFQYDIWGDTVNTASRLETNCEAGKVNISEQVYTHVKNHFSCFYRGKVATKGKGEIKMYYAAKRDGLQYFG